LFPIADTDNIMAGGHRLTICLLPHRSTSHAFAAWIFSSRLLGSLKIARVERSYASVASFVTRFSGIRTKRARCRNRRTGCGTGAKRTGHPITHTPHQEPFYGMDDLACPSLQSSPCGRLVSEILQRIFPFPQVQWRAHVTPALYFLYSFVVRAPRQSRVYGM